MDKKIWLETKEQKVATGLVIPVLAVGFCIPRDDRDRPRGSQGAPIEQPHDHHERAPIEATTLNTLAASGSSTASAITFSPVFFEAWKNGEVEWPVILRPDLYITVQRPDRQEFADRRDFAESSDPVSG
jgi:hypothetical protein